MSEHKIDMCPGCGDVAQTRRQEKHPNRCVWCGYNYDTGEVVGFSSASDPFDELDKLFNEPVSTHNPEKEE